MKTLDRPLPLWAAVCLLCLGLHPGLPAQEPKKPTRTLTFEVHYRIDVSAGTTSVNLVALVPQDLENRQQVQSLTFTPKPKKIFTSNGGRYARWEIRPEGDCTIKMRAKVLLHLMPRLQGG